MKYSALGAGGRNNRIPRGSRRVAYNPFAVNALPSSPAPTPADEALVRLAASGLRGRGGGWFEAARKWRAVIVEGGEPVVIANGAEGEPGSIKDRFVMKARPEALLRGLFAACRTVGARRAIVYTKATLADCAASVERSLDRVDATGIEISIVCGDESYVGGEETAVIEWLEGRRAWPRQKPPQPAAVGLDGNPTLVQNVETLSYVEAALADPERFRSEETTLVSLWGHVKRPGVYAVRLGTPLGAIVEQGGGAVAGVGMLFPGGPSAPPLDAAGLTTPLHPDALREAGSGLGTAALLVVKEGACPLSALSSAADFFAREACGQCPPCTLGSRNLAAVLRRIEGGEARGADLSALGEIAGFMGAHGYCAHGRTAANVITSGLARFRKDVEAHLSAGRCPNPDSACRPFDQGSTEIAAIEAALPLATGLS